MTPEKWRYFGIAFVVFVLVASLMIYDQGGFASIGLVGIAILLLAAAVIGLLLYFYVKKAPDDPFGS